MALYLFLLFGEEKCAPPKMLGQGLAHFFKQAAITGNQARFEEIGLHGYV